MNLKRKPFTFCPLPIAHSPLLKPHTPNQQPLRSPLYFQQYHHLTEDAA